MRYEMILFAEVRKDEKWTESDALRNVDHDTIFMNSILFPFLAGVDDIGDNERFKPKGIPEDLSKEVMIANVDIVVRLLVKNQEDQPW